MRKNDIRVMKMDRNDRSILMRALYSDFCANREAGRPNERHAALIMKVYNTPPGKLPLNGAEVGMLCSVIGKRCRTKDILTKKRM